MSNRPPFQAYPPPAGQQQDWNAYWATQQAHRPPGQPMNNAPAPPAQPPPPPPSAEHAALYANYGYGNQWRPPPPPQPLQPPPPPAQYTPMQPHPQQYVQPPYPVHGYQPVPVMWIQPPQPLGQPPLPPPQPMQQQTQPPRPPHLQQQAPHQPYYPTPPPNNNNNNNNNNPSQRFPPAKRPRFDNGRPMGSSGSSGSFSTINAAPQFTSQAQQNGTNSSNPSLNSLPAVPPPPTSIPQHSQHGRFPPQQPGFKSGRGSAPRGRGFNSRGGGLSGRGGMSGSMSAGSIRGTSGGGRGGSHGAPRGPSFRNQGQSKSGSSQSLNIGISSTSFNPQLSNGQSMPNLGTTMARSSRYNGSFNYGREGTPKRDEGSKKTLTDFRIIGVDCPMLGWSWGSIEPFEDNVPSPKAMKTEPEPTPSRATTPTADNPIPDSSVDSSTLDPSVPPPSAAASPIKEPQPRAPTETSRIRLYFNSPIDLEDKSVHGHTADRSRGGKRKKELEDSDPQEGSKRKKEDADHVSSSHTYLEVPRSDGPVSGPPLAPKAHPPPPVDNGHQHLEFDLESSRVGAKRKAHSLGPDDDGSGETASLDPASTTEVDAETEYAGSPSRIDPIFDSTASLQSLYSSTNEEEILTASQAPTEIAEDDFVDSFIEPAISPSTVNSEGKGNDPDIKSISAEDHKEPSLSAPDGETPPSAAEPTAHTPSGGERQSNPTEVTSSILDQDTPTQAVATTPISEQFPAVKTSSEPKRVPSQLPSPNRISISYAGSSRRLVLDADIVQKVKIFRSLGRIEVRFVLERCVSPVVSLSANPSNDVENVNSESLSSMDKSGSELNVESSVTQPDIKGETPPSPSAQRDGPAIQLQAVPVVSVESDEQKDSAGSKALVDEIKSIPTKDDCVEKEQATSQCRGILVEVFSESTKEYTPVGFPTDSEDPTLPDFSSILQDTPTTVHLIAYLDRNKPLSEPKWVKTGDIEDWLSAVFATKSLEERKSWAGKIEVTDPDPPPTIHTVLKAWATTSSVGTEKDRQRFLQEHMSSSIDNILEILLRLVRGSSHHSSTSNTSSMASISGSSSLPVIAPTPNAPHAPQQTHVSMAVLSIYRMAAEYAEKASEEHGRLEERVGNIVRALPQSALYKSLEGIFKDWSNSVGIPVPNGARKK